jgi:hypothetical protein
VRFCASHPQQTAVVSLSAADLQGIGCPGHNGLPCVPSQLVEDGVFLFHVGCRCTSPFLLPDGKTLDVASRTRLDGRVVNHWQIALAEQLAAICPRTEMWFPQALFRAANERVGDRPLGRLVMLAGAQSVGKTVLSLMAMHPRSYRRGHVQHFAHITDRQFSSNEDLLTVLDALNQSRRGTLRSSMMPTTATHFTNIKCVLAPCNGGTAGDATGRPSRDGGVVRPMDLVRDLLGRLVPVNGVVRSMPITHLVVAFYDTSGELWQTARGSETMAVRAHADVHAVVADMSAFSCFGVASASHDSTWVAREQIEKARRRNVARCVVLTKLDLIEHATTAGATPAISGLMAHVRNAQRAGTPPRVDGRAVLHACLAESKDYIECQLWQDIVDDPALEIFFVWTEGLGSSDGQVEPYGVEAFLDWCLDRAKPAEPLA